MRLALAIPLALSVAFFGICDGPAPAFAQDAEQTQAPKPKQKAKPRQRAAAKRPADPDIVLRAANRARMNENSVTVLSGNRDGQSLGYAYDLSAVLDDNDEMRVLPMAGKGGAQNVRDILWLRGIDMGLTQANVLNHLAKTGELGDIKGQLAYVAKLFNEEMHILGATGVASFEDLAGKKVNLGDEGSGTDITAQLIFKHFGIEVEGVHLDQNDAIAKVKSGEIAATILIGGKPSPAFTHVRAADGLKLIDIPYRPDMEVEYYPATLTSEDYPDLIPQGENVDTIAVCAVLVAFNWDKNSYRGKRVARFVDAFFEKYDKFHEAPRHPKWREVNFAAELETWTRLPAAQEWIDKADPQVAEAQRAEFETFVAQQNAGAGAAEGAGAAPAQTEAEREALFKAYLAWSKQQQQQQSN
jgi:TRAP transporter TAXI family solute receptor